MHITLAEFESLCITEIVDDLVRIKRDKDTDDMRNLSMHGIDIKNIEYYRKILRKQECERLDREVDYDVAQNYLDKRAKDWQ